jgi:PrgI family protein
MMMQRSLPRYTVPVLDAPDTVFSAQGFDLSVRQLACVFLGGMMSVNVWVWLAFLPESWVALRCVLVSLPLVLALLFGWVQVQRRPLEHRLFCLLRFYVVRPRIYVWRSVTQEDDHSLDGKDENHA